MSRDPDQIEQVDLDGLLVDDMDESSMLEVCEPQVRRLSWKYLNGCRVAVGGEHEDVISRLHIILVENWRKFIAAYGGGRKTARDFVRYVESRLAHGLLDDCRDVKKKFGSEVPASQLATKAALSGDEGVSITDTLDVAMSRRSMSAWRAAKADEDEEPLTPVEFLDLTNAMSDLQRQIIEIGVQSGAHAKPDPRRSLLMAARRRLRHVPANEIADAINGLGNVIPERLKKKKEVPMNPETGRPMTEEKHIRSDADRLRIINLIRTAPWGQKNMILRREGITSAAVQKWEDDLIVKGLLPPRDADLKAALAEIELLKARVSSLEGRADRAEEVMRLLRVIYDAQSRLGPLLAAYEPVVEPADDRHEPSLADVPIAVTVAREGIARREAQIKADAAIFSPPDAGTDPLEVYDAALVKAMAEQTAKEVLGDATPPPEAPAKKPRKPRKDKGTKKSHLSFT